VALSDQKAQSLVIEVGREIDLSNVEELRARLGQARSESARVPGIYRDFAECEFIDSTGLQVVLHGARLVRHDGGELAVVNLGGDAARVFEVCGLLIDGSAIINGSTHAPDGRE